MQTLLNLLPNLTPEQHRELSTELHVVEQVSLAQSAYPGAPMPHIEDQRRAAKYLGNYLRLLNEELDSHP